MGDSSRGRMATQDLSQSKEVRVLLEEAAGEAAERTRLLNERITRGRSGQQQWKVDC